jgi:DNA-binding MarR family transcriptional regulator
MEKGVDMREGVARLGLLLRQSHRDAVQLLNAALAPLGFAGRHFGVLLIIDRDGTSTQRELQAEQGGDKARVARTVADLESLGLVARDIGPADRRVVHLHLTERGRAGLYEARRLASTVGDYFVSDLDDVELAQLLWLLQRLNVQPQPSILQGV